MKKIYISGPMTGYPDYNYTYRKVLPPIPVFDRAEIELREKGFDVINPANLARELLKQKPNAIREDFLREDIKALLYCDYIFLLKGWEKSLS